VIEERAEWVRDYLQSLQLAIDDYPEEFENDLKAAFEAGWDSGQDKLTEEGGA